MVRQYNETDIPFIIDGLKSFNIVDNNDIFKNSINNFIVCEFNNKKCGFIQYSKYYDRIEIDYILVSLEYRRCGLASKMLEFLINYCKNEKQENITLEVSEKNVAAINLYKKMGFEVCATRDNYYGHGENALLMIWRS